MRFEWDPAKDRANQEKHGLSFEQAAQLFEGGPEILEFYDQEHSHDEDRFNALGNTPSGIIRVVFTEPEEDVIRILSARPATRRERERLEVYWRGKHD